MSDTLGQYIKRMRKANCLTLRLLGDKTGLSNGYISQIETGKVAKPSANKLWKLSESLNVPYETLMVKAGIIPTINIENYAENNLGELTEEEETKMLEYLKFIRFQKSVNT